MSEEKSDPPSSSVQPGVRRPTVMGEQNGAKETTPQIISRNPTVIGGGKPVPHVQHAHAPTAIPPGIPQPSIPSAKPSVAITAPSVMPGTIRKGLDVSLSDLEARFPGSSRETLERVGEILKSTIVETLNSVTCSQWGSSIQASYSVLVNESLTLTTAPSVRDGARHAQRLYAILAEVGSAFHHEGFHLRRQKTPWEKLTEVRVELDQLRAYLGSILPELRTIQSKLEAISSKLVVFSVELDASSIAAQFVADHMGGADSRSLHLMDQSVSLTKMIAHIQESVMLRSGTIDEIDVLADRIQESVLVTLPAWIEKVSLVSPQSSTDTERYTLREGLEEILNQLK